MASFEDDVSQCYRLLEEEISAYRSLNDELKRQGEALKSASVEDLMTAVRNVEEETERLRALHAALRGVLQNLVPSGKEEGATLSEVIEAMPPDHRARMQSYKRALDRLRGRMERTNTRHQVFLREYLQVVSELVSWILHPSAEPAGYSGQSRRALSGPVAYSFQREV